MTRLPRLIRFPHRTAWTAPRVAVGASAGVAALLALVEIAGCADVDEQTSAATSADAGSVWRDAATVEAPEAGPSDAGLPPAAPSCERYCELVTESCADAHAQYASVDECLAFCAVLPLGKTGDVDSNSVACRQFYAGSPAKTDAPTYCLASGPFGGGLCGDRCTSFCELTAAICAAGDMKQGGAPYPSGPECASACASFVYRDAGIDGGGEGPNDSASGNTLNCRLNTLREAIVDAGACSDLGTNSEKCR